MSTTANAAGSVAGKYLTIVLENEAYGLNVLQIREIIRLPKITPVPQLPDHVKGVINLRGRVVPVVDLRVKLGLKAGFTERTGKVRTSSGPSYSLRLVRMGRAFHRPVGGGAARRSQWLELVQRLHRWRPAASRRERVRARIRG